MLHCFLVENDFVQNPVDHCAYSKQIGSKLIMMLIWVDDIIVAASDMALMSEAKQILQVKFHMKDIGKLSHFSKN